jgi:transposase-like protein
MASVDRNNPKRGKGSESTYSMMEFMREFPDDAACLDYLWRERYAPDGHTTHCPKCDRERRFHRVKDRPAYDCDTCGHHIHPTAGTIFHKSSTSLHLWFYAAYIITSTRCGVSAKTLERELGVTYKTAWRMFTLIRNELMSQDDDGILGGEVEVDETFMVGNRMRNRERRERQAAGVKGPRPAPIVFGAAERGGPIRATVIPDSQGKTVLSKTIEYVLPRSLIYTDEYVGYEQLGRIGYTHKRIRHLARIYVEGDTHTQTIDGFFGLLKNGIRATHHGVSHKWLQGYLNEYVWRWNRRDSRRAMFRDLIAASASGGRSAL